MSVGKNITVITFIASLLLALSNPGYSYNRSTVYDLDFATYEEELYNNMVPSLVEPSDSGDLPYPIQDTRFDYLNDQPSNNPFDLQPSQSNIEYDPVTGEYSISNPSTPYMPPQTLEFDEFWDIQDNSSMSDYWQNQSQNNSNLGYDFSGLAPKLELPDNMGGIFGDEAVDIRPTGGIELIMGYRRQIIDNPTLLEWNRDITQPDFDMNINMGVTGKIGNNLNFNINYNTQATFDFERRLKLEYTGDEDDILQKIEAGYVDFPLPTTLIPGSHSLFGLKTQLKFGRLTATTVLSQQKSEKRCFDIEQGALRKEFEIRSDQFEENKHFFLAQYFRDNYNRALSTLPYIQSEVFITYVEVWVTNRTGTTQDTRNVLALMDLGETDPHRQPNITPQVSDNFPRNEANSLYGSVAADGDNRSIDNVITNVEQTLQLSNTADFRLTEARRLRPNEFTYDPQLGYISLNTGRLQTEDILAVAYEYTTIWGDTYKVGEFSQDRPPNINDSGREQVLLTKMLKTRGQPTSLPVWDLMMRNVYKLPGAYRVNKDDFRLNVFYETPGGGVTRFLPDGENVRDKLLIQLLGLDNMNFQNDPKPDGVFDFFTAQPVAQNPQYATQNQFGQSNTGGRGRGSNFGGNNRGSQYGGANAQYFSTMTQNGLLFFPVVEPFGEDLKKNFSDNEAALANSFAYDYLYDTTLVIARQFPEKNRFLIKGQFKSNNSSEIILGAFNIPQGSIVVRAGGQLLREGSDYTVNYGLGRVNIINDAYLNSGIPIQVCYEDQNLFSIQQKTLFGTRLDYWINDDFTLGGTYVHLSQRPFTQKVNYGDDAISNRMVGLDGNYYKESPWLTRMVDKIPFIDTKEKSSVSFNAEAARFIPGHAKAIDLGSNGVVFLDDFEGTQSQLSMEFPITAWSLASTPTGGGPNGEQIFPTADLKDDLSYGYQRGTFAWYKADYSSIRRDSMVRTHYNRNIQLTEVFPQKQFEQGQVNLLSFDLAYFPERPGPYNFASAPSDLDQNGNLVNPKESWGGMMRELDLNDFQFHNIEYIEFWMLDPFIDNPDHEGGTMFIDLGTVSEDVLKDGRRSFENGLPTPNQPENTDTTLWARVSKNNVIARFFDSDTTNRRAQDVGFDGLDNEGERILFQNYLAEIEARADLSQDVKDAILADPANDDFVFFTDYPASTDMSERYSRFNHPQGNSVRQDQEREDSGQSRITRSATNLPDNEDLNDDNALEQTESYFQYRIELRPEDLVMAEQGSNFITSIQESNSENAIVDGLPARWLKFQIPVAEFEAQVGEIANFTSIQFMRVYMTDFAQPVVCRLADFNLIRNQWRRYESNIYEEGEYQPSDNITSSQFNSTSVSFEQHYNRQPVPYRIPLNVQQEQIFNNTTTPLLQNEQSLALQVCDLEDGVANAVFKTERYDMRMFKRLQMLIHAEEGLESTSTLQNGDVSAIIRIGSDFTSNYYEYEVPLTVTPHQNYGNSDADRRAIWPEGNRVDIALDDLVELKKVRNYTLDSPNFTKPFSRFVETELVDSLTGESKKLRRKITIVGSPDLGKVSTIMLGVRNPKRTALTLDTDDGLTKCAEVWFNEMALAEFNEEGGYAALARMDVKLADFGNVTVSGNMHTAGFGTLEQKIVDRFQDNLYQYDATANINLDKFLPKKSGIRIPMYAGYSESVSNPKYDPYNTDIILKEALDSIELYKGREARDSVKKQAQEYTSIKSLNFSNVRKIRTNTEKKQRFYDIENFNLTAAYTEINYRDPTVEKEKEKRYRGELGYAYSTRPKYIRPFNKLIKSKNKYLKPIKDFNFNFVPSSLSFRTDLNRLLVSTKLRNLVGDDFEMPTFYNKDFTWGRHYGLKLDLAKSLSLDFQASNNSRIDEPQGAPTDEAKEELWNNFKKLGRTLNYNQKATVNWNVPIDKFPLFDWTKIRTSYETTYNWVTGPEVLIDSLDIGNTISNNRNIRINGELNFSKLYNKSKFLKKINTPSKKKNNRPPRDKEKGKDKDKDKDKEDDKTKEKKKRNASSINPGVKAVVSPLIMLKRASLTFTQRQGTEVPGFMPQSQLLGQNWSGNGVSSAAPGLDFLFGMQPDTTWLNEAASKNWITTNPYLNRQVRQTYDRSIQGKATIEPFNGFKIDLTLTQTHRETRTEFFKVNRDGEFEHLAPTDIGSYTVSYLPFKTAWDNPGDSVELSETYQKFERNRSIISQRLGEDNFASTGTYYSPIDSTFLNDYSRGYGPYSQDVLLASFISAYKGVDADDIQLKNILRQAPLPNWTLTWNGLNNIKALQNVLSSINITHGYKSTYTINQFRTEQSFNSKVYPQNTNLQAPYVMDTLSGNFYPNFRIPDVQISEQFVPLIGLDMAFTNNFTARFQYNKSRILGLSLVDFQINESLSEEFTIGAGYQIAGLQLPFKNKDGENIVLKNDLTFNCDFSLMDNITSVYALDQDIAQPTTGNNTLRLSPTIDYVVNDRIRLTLYYERTRTRPYTSQSYPTINTKGGIRLNFSLAQ